MGAPTIRSPGRRSGQLFFLVALGLLLLFCLARLFLATAHPTPRRSDGPPLTAFVSDKLGKNISRITSRPKRTNEHAYADET